MTSRISKRDQSANSELDQLAEELNLRVTIQDTDTVTIQFRIPDHMLLPSDQTAAYESTMLMESRRS